MGDMYSKEKRSQIMSLIRSKDTIAERIVFSFLRSKKIYFQRHYKRAMGSPDVALPRKKKAVFVDGDFWHGRELERLMDRRSADDFWVAKIKANVERDTKQRQALLDSGWQILAVWESDLKRKRTRDETLESIEAFLTNPN
jgi:DNA mismatch endonuclease (patch repair protein)